MGAALPLQPEPVGSFRVERNTTPTNPSHKRRKDGGGPTYTSGRRRCMGIRTGWYTLHRTSRRVRGNRNRYENIPVR